MLSYLQEKHDALIELYQTHRESILDLQATLLREVLPELVTALDLDDRSSQWAREWIDDSGSIFRMLKKHNFSISEATAALQQTLHWRVSVLAPLHNAAIRAAPFIQCLPRHARDKSDRPVLLVQLARLSGASDQSKQDILRMYEEMRMRLYSLQGREVFQCVIVVDFKDATMRSMAVELIPWFIREVGPRFPGMCAAVLMVNYSWTYSGMYNLVKRLLPSNVLARISFPTQRELLSHFDRDRLPRDYGGQLDWSTEYAYSPTNFGSQTMRSTSPPPQQESRSTPQLANMNLSSYLPSTSLLNPYFGYPVFSNPDSSIPYLKNGRRRKRDLARTLALLWLARLKRSADKTWLWIIVTLVLWAAGLRR